MFIVDELNPNSMRKYRLYLDYSQDEIAELLGVNRVSYSRWESGAQKPESPKMIALSFEALLNRKLTAETESLFQKEFKTMGDNTNRILAEIDQMQKMRVAKK
jgi:DNA-binding XRE family transcriptional regulator